MPDLQKNEGHLSSLPCPPDLLGERDRDAGLSPLAG